MNVLMVGVDSKRVGGMWTVAETYIKNKKYNQHVNLIYIPTITAGSLLKRSFFMLNAYRRVLWVLCTYNIDLVHIHMAEKGSTFRKGLIAKWGRWTNKKVVIHLHAGPFMSWYTTQGQKRKKCIKNIFACANRVCVLGKYWKIQLTDLVQPEKLVVLYNGVPCPKANPYNKAAKNIVYLGVMLKTKGIYDLIEAIGQIEDSLPSEVQLQLCGVDLEGDIAEIIAKKKLSGRIKLLGWIDQQEKENIFQGAMMVVLPSYFEGLSMTVIEAMAHGIPVITTNISTMPELLGLDTDLIEPGDVKSLGEYILKLSMDAHERSKISTKVFERAKNFFSEDSFIDKTLSVYKECENDY